MASITKLKNALKLIESVLEEGDLEIESLDALEDAFNAIEEIVEAEQEQYK